MSKALFFVAGLTFFLILPVPVQAQSSAAAWQNVPFGDEELSPVINQIVVDGGVLWVGTNDGLWRFDGRAAERWDTDESNHILSLLIDKEDRLWIGTTRGLTVLSADRDWSDRVELLPDLREPIWVLESASNGSVWVGSDRGLYNVSLAVAPNSFPETMEPVGLLTEAIHALSQAGSGDLWIGTRDSGLFILQQTDEGQPQPADFAAEMHPRINALLLNEEGQLWIGTEGGLCILKSGDSAAACRLSQFDDFERQPITGLFPDSSMLGAIWIATPDRLWHYSPPTKPTEELLSTDVRTIAGDGEGQLWAGATSGLLLRRSPAWRPLLAGLDRDMQDVLAIVEDSHGVLWVGTDKGLLKQEADDSWQAVEALESQTISCLFASKDESSLWACLDDGVAQIELNGAGRSPPVLVGESVNDIWQDGDGTLWFATHDGVWQKTSSELKQHLSPDDSATGPASNYVTALAGDGQGGFWAGTTAGLSHFDGSNWQPPACPALGDEINELVWDGARNQLWVATRDGLALCDGEAYVVQPTEGEIIDDNIRILALEGAQAGKNEPAFLLIGTFEGLSRVDIRDPRPMKLPVTSFSKDSNLPDNRIQALYVRDDGQLLLGTPFGLYVYQPSDQAPELHFCHPTCSEFDSLREPGEPLTIVYNDEEPLRVFGHDLRTDADNLLYRYEIVSGDKISQTWSATGDLNLSTNLLPADEDMMVTAWAYDRDFNRTADPAVLEIIRQPEPLEQRTQFQVFIIVFTAAIIALAWRLIRRLQFVPYQNLEVTISPISEKFDFQQVQVRGGRWLFSIPNQLQKGSSRWFFEIPAEDRLRNIESIQTALDQITKLDEMTDIDEKLSLLQEVGGKLYASLFSDETAVVLRDKLGLGDGNNPVRLRLVIDPELTGADALPWELLYGGDKLQFLTIDSNVALVRDYPIATATPNNVRSDLKVLLLISTPRELPLKKETINKEIEALRSFTKDNLRITRHATQEDLQDLTAGGYDLIHFLGHGDLDDGQGILYFEDEGDAHPIYQDVLVKHFSEAQPTLIFLNACRSAKSDDPDDTEITLADSQQGSNSLAAALVTEANIPAVVGMGYEFDSEAANEFSRAFYQRLIQLGQVDDAVANGREILSTRNTFDRMASVASRDWFTPRLYVGLRDNAIYKQSLPRQHHLVQAVRSRFANNDENSER